MKKKNTQTNKEVEEQLHDNRIFVLCFVDDLCTLVGFHHSCVLQSDLFWTFTWRHRGVVFIHCWSLTVTDWVFWLMSFPVSPTASAEDKRLYTDAIVTYELMHIGHGVDSERLDPVFPPACAFNAAASFLFAKVRQSEMTFFIHDPHVNKTVWPGGPTADITTSVLLFSLQHPWKKTLPYCM